MKGLANMISATQKSELGFDQSCTHYLTGRMEIPGAGISETAPSVTYGGSAVPANQMKKIGAAWYLDFVFGLKDDGSGNVVAASGSTNFVVVCGGITTTVTPDFSGVELA